MAHPRDRTKIQERSSDAISVTFDPKLCIHAAACLQSLPEVFNLAALPWIQPGEATADDVAETVMRCPSGALQFRRLDGGPQEPHPAETTVATVPNGPLLLRGDLRFRRPNAEIYREATRATLCRCGHSAHKPFCDATHRRIGFQAD